MKGRATAGPSLSHNRGRLGPPLAEGPSSEQHENRRFFDTGRRAFDNDIVEFAIAMLME